MLNVFEKTNNNDFMFELLKLKLESNSVDRYKNERYFIITENECIVRGISRITILENEELENFLKSHYNEKFQLKINSKIYYLNGIWIEPSYRNKGFGKKLINERIKIINNNQDIIISAVEETSPLLNYYKKHLKMKILHSENGFHYMKNK